MGLSSGIPEIRAKMGQICVKTARLRSGRKGLKIPRRRLRIGSSPISGTKKMGVINTITPFFDVKNVNWGELGGKMAVLGLFLHKIV